MPDLVKPLAEGKLSPGRRAVKKPLNVTVEPAKQQVRRPGVTFSQSRSEGLDVIFAEGPGWELGMKNKFTAVRTFVGKGINNGSIHVFANKKQVFDFIKALKETYAGVSKLG